MCHLVFTIWFHNSVIVLFELMNMKSFNIITLDSLHQTFVIENWVFHWYNLICFVIATSKIKWLQQAIKVIEERNQGRSDKRFMVDYCWNLKQNKYLLLFYFLSIHSKQDENITKIDEPTLNERKSEDLERIGKAILCYC